MVAVTRRDNFREFRKTWEWRATLVLFGGYIVVIAFTLHMTDAWWMNTLAGVTWWIGWQAHTRAIYRTADSDEWQKYDQWYQEHKQNIRLETDDTARSLLTEIRLRGAQRCRGRVHGNYADDRTTRCRLDAHHHGPCK